MLPFGAAGVFIALCVHASGDFVAAATDDKHVSVYDLARPTNFRRVVYRAPTPKRASAVCFAGGAAAGAADDEGEWLLVADKWGDVFGIAMTEVWPPCEVGLAPDAESRPLSLVLGHCCSIIGSLAASPCGAALATGDRDGRCRLTAWPRGGSLNREMCGARGGAAEVLSFCLGHEDFLTKVAFVEGVPGAADADGEGDGDAVLVTCGGDGSVRVWAWRSGEELARWDCAREEGACKAVVDVVSLGGGALAVAVEDAPGVTVLLLTDGGRRLADDTARSEALSSALAAARELGAPPCALARVCIEGDAALAAAAVRAKSAEELVAAVAIEGDADTSEALTAALNEEVRTSGEHYVCVCVSVWWLWANYEADRVIWHVRPRADARRGADVPRTRRHAASPRDSAHSVWRPPRAMRPSSSPRTSESAPTTIRRPRSASTSERPGTPPSARARRSSGST